MFEKILIANGYVTVPEYDGVENLTLTNLPLATVISNMASFGYAPNADALRALSKLGHKSLGTWWNTVCPIMALLSGASRKIDKHVVYKNFPQEVLDFEGAEWMIRQIIIYLTLDSDLVTQEERERPALTEKTNLKVLAPAVPSDIDTIISNLIVQRNAWSDNQREWADTYFAVLNQPRGPFDADCQFEIAAFGFRENAIYLANKFKNVNFIYDAATDVLRLAAAMSGADTSLREKVVLRAFKRGERRKLLTILDGVSDIEADMALRPELWKRFMQRVRPGDYKFANVSHAYDKLYNRKVQSFNSVADPQVVTIETLNTVAAMRPGVFVRNFHRYYAAMGPETVSRMIHEVIPKMTVRQLASFRKYIETINDRSHTFVSPRGIMRKARILENNKVKIKDSDREMMMRVIGDYLAQKIGAGFTDGVRIDESLKNIKIPSNNQKLAEYGRGTTFPIPDNINFIRSVSYWEDPQAHSVWYDNGWNFYSEKWTSMGACCWNAQAFSGKAAIMSGDPTNVTDKYGRAGQLIDLYLDQLAAKGVRYAVWSVLCYSHRKFSEAKDVFGALMWGEDASAGKLFEPASAQMLFPIKSDDLTNFIAMVDIKERKLVYLDAPLRGHVLSAVENNTILGELMPAFLESIDAIPSLYDVLKEVPVKKNSMPVSFSDETFDSSVAKSFALVRNNAEVGGQRVPMSAFIDL